MVHDSPVTLSGSMEPDFKVGEWWVRPQRNELEHGDTVEQVEARSMAVLVCLAADAPRVVSKKKLLRRVWGESVFVGDEVISHAIWDLRRALGDSAKNPVFIQTVPRKGYRLLQEVLRLQGSALPAVGARIDHYEIEEELGHGSMGVVFRARDCRLDRSVAIKFLAQELTRDLSANQRFQREASLAASLDHPHLAAVHDIGATVGGQQYIVMPFYAGGSLKQRLAHGPVPVHEAVEIGRQLASGLAAAHRRDIIHRDIKPANILLDEHGTPKISDFGIAKLLGGTDLTRTGASLGTPAYKSPEQSRGEPVDHRSDIWSLGVVLFELLTGRRPFDGDFDQAVVHSILSKDPEPLEDATGQPIPEAVRRVVCKAMAKEPGERFQGAGELEEALVGVSSTSHSRAWLPTAKVDKPRSGTKHSSRWAAVLGVVAVIGGLSFLYYWLFWSAVPMPGPPPQAGDISVPVRSQPLPHKPAAHLVQARTDWLSGDDTATLERVSRQLRLARNLAPNHPEVLSFLAFFKADLYARRQRELERIEAETLITRVLEYDPFSYPLAWAALARLRLTEKRIPEALEAAQKALGLERECSKVSGDCDLAYVMLAEALFLQKEPELRWVEVLETGIEQGAGHIRCRLKLAQLYQYARQPDRAAAVYEDLLTIDAEQTTALNDLGVLYLKMGRFKDAKIKLEALYRKVQDRAVASNLGFAFYGLRRWEDALRFFEEAHRLNLNEPDPSPNPAVGLGDTLLEMGRVEEAKIWFQKALEIFDRWAESADVKLDLLGRRAACLAKLGRFEEAEQEIQRLLEQAPRSHLIWLYAARISAVQRDRSTLLDRARRAIEEGALLSRLEDDAAFIDFREDDEYQQVLAQTRRLPPTL
ncbi:MAG: protein kinase [Acidobacteriota bacterium]|nr:protein kinase [Acidobacteriota bacterium]